MSELKIVFNLFDSTSKGYLEAREFRECLRMLGVLKTDRYNLHYKDVRGGIIPKNIEKFDFVEFVEFVRDRTQLLEESKKYVGFRHDKY